MNRHYDLISYKVRDKEKEGFELKSIFYEGTYYIPDDANKKDILKIIKAKEGVIIDLYSDGFIGLMEEDTGKPVGSLRRTKVQKERKKMNKWRPIDTTPFNEKILILSLNISDEFEYSIVNFKNPEWLDWKEREYISWMPLPELPKLN